MTGIVRDTGGAVVPGATVELTQTDTNSRRTVTTNGDGVFTAAALAPGEYRIIVSMAGFTAIRQEPVRLATGETHRFDAVLQVASVREEVNVVRETPSLRQDRASLGTIVDSTQVAQLPLNGRSFITLAGLVPGVALPPNSQLPRINGGRPRTNEYLFDGISVLQPEPGQVAYFPVIDSIQEFRVESNSPPAEFGRFNGGVVNLTTGRAPTACRHRLRVLPARSAERAQLLSVPDPEKPGPAQPVRRDGRWTAGEIRTFFFVDYQGQRQNIGRTVISTVPTVLQREGVFTEAIGGRVPTIFDPASGTDTRTAFPGNTVPTSRMDPAAVSLLQRYPLPTSAGTANNYRRTANEGDDRTSGPSGSITISRATGTRRLRGSPGSREHSRR